MQLYFKYKFDISQQKTIVYGFKFEINGCKSNLILKLYMYFKFACLNGCGYRIMVKNFRGEQRILYMKNIILRLLRATIGLILGGFATYMTIQANIGLAPWEAFNMGISNIFGISYGQGTVIVSFVIIIIDILMKEHIGYGTILDAVIVGTSIDIFTYFKVLPKCTTVLSGIIYMFIGLTLLSVAIYFYMSASLGCGPRDMFMVAVGRRFRKVPIGAVNICIYAVVTVIAYIFKAPIGIGTIISVFGLGSILQLVFKIFKYEPRDTVHESITDTTKEIIYAIKG